MKRIDYLSVPIELIACPFFSEKEKLIISHIIDLSDNFINTGGCTKTNKELAFRFRTSPQTVSNTISKAKKLGFVVLIENKNERKIQMGIPIEWQMMGDLYNHAFTQPNEEISKLFIKIEKEILSLPKNKWNKIPEIIKQSIRIYQEN